MQAPASAHLEEARNQRMLIQDQLVKIHNKINELIIKQKRIEAEIEEVGTAGKIVGSSQCCSETAGKGYMEYLTVYGILYFLCAVYE